MTVGTYIAVYLVVWWTVLFAVLPFGQHSQTDAGHVVPGTDPGAPAVFRAWPKIIATTILAAVVTAGLFWVLSTPLVQAYLRQ